MTAGRGTIGNLVVDLAAKTARFSKGMNLARLELRSFRKQVGGNLKQIDRQFTKTGKKVEKFGRGMKGAFAGLGAGVGVSRLGTSLNATMRRSIRFEQQMKLVTGTVAGAKEEFRFITDLAEEMGLNITALGPAYGKFNVAAQLAGMTGHEVRQIFQGVSEAAIVNKMSTEDQALAFLALEQMINKGVVSMEELRRQLGEKMPGAFAMASKAMGVTTAEFTKMVAAGEVVSKDFLPKFAEELHKTFGDAAKEASQSSIASINRMHSSFERLRLKLVNSGYDDLIGNLAKSAGNSANEMESHITTMVASLQFFGEKGALAINAIQIAVDKLKKEFEKTEPDALYDLSFFGILGSAVESLGMGFQILTGIVFKAYGALALFKGADEEAALAFKHSNELLSGKINLFEELSRKIKTAKEAEKSDGQIGLTKAPAPFVTEHSPGIDSNVSDKFFAKLEERNADLLSSQENIKRWWEEVDRLAQVARDLDLEFNFEGNFNEAVIELQYLRDEAMITANVFDRAMEQLVSNTGRSLKELEDELTESQKNIQDVMSSVQGALTDGFTSTFKSILDGTGSFKESMSRLLRSVAAEIFKVMVAQKAAAAIMGMFGGVGARTGATVAVADGGVFQNGQITTFAKGGIVNSPTIFPMANGAGLMGEAGPEAVMPLKRDSLGRLGVIANGVGAGGGGKNVVVQINIDASGNEETNQENSDSSSREIADRLKSVVLAVIMEEQSPGGLLAEGV